MSNKLNLSYNQSQSVYNDTALPVSDQLFASQDNKEDEVALVSCGVGMPARTV